jgi:PKD repeat protein
MVFSTDGGTTWQTDAALDTMMTGGGVFKYQNTFGPTSTTFSTNGIQNFPQRQGYPQPSLVAYDPTNGNNIVAGGHDSGVFLSTDGGTTWQLLDDPINGDTSTQHIPRPWFAAFDHRPAGTTEIYIGTQGRGVYRMSGITLSVMAPGNQTAAEGANQPFNLGSFTDPDGGPWSVDVNWGDMGPHTTFTTTTTGSLGTRTHTFGEEGTYTVTVMVTDTTGGDSDSKTFTVTVSDPAVLATGVPVSAVEGAAFAGRAVATFTDPGGAEPNPSDPDPELSHHYTAMINWGDPTPPTAGTITFSAGTFTVSGNHTYGEEGTFTVTTTINHEGIITVTTSTASVSDPAVLPKGVPVFAVACRTFTAEVATFTDPGGAEPNPSDPDPELSHHYTAMIDWGDLTPPSAGTITYSGPPGSTTEPFIVTGTHAYALEGIYTVTTTIDHESIISVTTSTATIKDDIGLLLLDPTGSKSLFVTGNGSVTATECGAVVVDSNNARDAAFLAGHGTVTAQDIDVTGGARTVGHGSFSVAVDHETATPDPLGLALPPPPSMHFPAVHYSGDAPLTLSPGTYDGGIEITGHGAVTLLPGIYYLNGGGFRVSGKGSVTGDDVLIVNAPGGPEDTIDISGQGAVTLTALSSGPYQGVVILQDPASADPLHFTGQGAVTLTGVVYVPDAPVSITGNANVTINPGPGTAVAPPPILGALIAFDLKVAGNGVLTINPDDPAGPGAPSSPGRGLFVSRAVNAGLNDGDSAQGDDAFLGQIVFLLSRDQQAGRPSPASAPVTRSGAGTTAASPAALDWLFSGNSGDTGSAWSRENVPADRSHAAWVDPLGGQLVDELLSSLVQVA